MNTQFRVYPLERALKSALSSSVNLFVLNLTLADSQSDFVRNHVNIIPVLLKIILKDAKRNFVLNTKRLDRFSMRQKLGLILKVKPFLIFVSIHNYKFDR